MPRFYFHTETDVRTTDYEGHECASYLDARREGIATCGQMMKDARIHFGVRVRGVFQSPTSTI